MKLSKKQKKLLSFIQSTTMGLVSITDSDTSVVAWQLHTKGLLDQRVTNVPFSGSVSYWVLTPAGRDCKP